MGWETLVDWERATWQEAEAALSRVQDPMGHRIDAGIVAPVIGLNLLGLHTTSSCEGHLHWGCPYPWIDFYREVEHAEEVWEGETASNAQSTPQTRKRTLLMQSMQRDPLSQRLLALQAEYLATRQARMPGDDAVILLAPFAPGWSRLLAAEPGWWQRWEEREVAEETAWWEQTPLQEQAERLARAQAEMAAFAAFLKEQVLIRSQREAGRAATAFIHGTTPT